MTVSTDITRSDLVLFNLAFAPRSRASHVIVAVLSVGYFIYFGLTRPPDSPVEWLILAGIAIVGAVIALLIMTLVGIAIILMTASRGQGVLGRHDFALTPEGLHESTTANVQLSRWSGMHSVEQVGSYLVVRLTPYLVHVIPRRAFASGADFNDFANQAAAYLKASRSPER
jgi:hypothetical protein